MVQQVKVGSIDIMLTGSSIWATVAPDFGMLDLGYVFDSYAHMAKALDGGVGVNLAEILRNRTGCTIMGWGSHFAARSVYTKAPVKSMAQLKGVKLRVLPTSAFIDTFKLAGSAGLPRTSAPLSCRRRRRRACINAHRLRRRDALRSRN